MNPPIYALPTDLTKWLNKNIQTKNVKILSESILRLSDFYVQESGLQSPWSETWAQEAYLFYFFPLNLLRSQRVVEAGRQLKFFADLTQVEDFGSGLGSGTWPLMQAEIDFLFIEQSTEATERHRKLVLELNLAHKSVSWSDQIRKNRNPEKLLRTMSYSYNESHDKEVLPWLAESEAVMILEPSTEHAGRKLLQLRQFLQEKGFQIWAPCTHQQSCPMLQHSKADWCHDRLHVQLPEYFQELEKYLPMQNRTLTTSYLLARKSTPPHQKGWTRAVGDRLDEKGKSRILVCKNDQREWLSWLKRQGEAPDLYRGELFYWPEEPEVKGQEYRLDPRQKIQRVLLKD